MSNGLPQIRVEIDGMRHGMITALSKYHGDVEEAVAQELDHIVNNFDIGEVVRKTAPRELEKWVESTVSWAIQRMLNDTEVLLLVQKAISDGILGAIAKREEEEEAGKE